MALDLPEQNAVLGNVAWFTDSLDTIKRLLVGRQSLPISLGMLSIATLGVATHVEWIPTLPHDQLAQTLAQYTLIGCSVGNLALSGAIAQFNAICGPQPNTFDIGTE